MTISFETATSTLSFGLLLMTSIFIQNMNMFRCLYFRLYLENVVGYETVTALRWIFPYQLIEKKWPAVWEANVENVEQTYAMDHKEETSSWRQRVS